MLDEYGYTSKRAGLTSSRNHTAECRHRVEDSLDQDERGQAARKRADERWTHWAAKESEKAENENTKGCAAKENDSAENENKKEWPAEEDDEKGGEEELVNNDASKGATTHEDEDQGLRMKAEDMPILQEEHNQGEFRGDVGRERPEGRSERPKRKEATERPRDTRRRVQLQPEKRDRSDVGMEAEKKRKVTKSSDAKRTRLHSGDEDQ